VERHIIYYKGEGGGFPQVRAMVSLVSPNLLVACAPTFYSFDVFTLNSCLNLSRRLGTRHVFFDSKT
jgi:hypothetical protein